MEELPAADPVAVAPLPVPLAALPVAADPETCGIVKDDVGIDKAETLTAAVLEP